MEYFHISYVFSYFHMYFLCIFIYRLTIKLNVVNHLFVDYSGGLMTSPLKAWAYCQGACSSPIEDTK